MIIVGAVKFPDEQSLHRPVISQCKIAVTMVKLFSAFHTPGGSAVASRHAVTGRCSAIDLTNKL